ncbi:CSM3 [Candida margitis]|uniref:CSM3 n=1 Tax=Candida margitis TaxID=1775924 RepID=UPI002227929D|nr:CSM3 [Candida margitis]KAI5969458.1 CSM3 [Candida margitis]
MSSNSHATEDVLEQNASNNGNNLLDDPALLGIDEPLKLKTRKKIAKIDDERLLHNPRGLPYLLKNQRRLLRIIEKNDKEFYKQEKEKLAVQPNYKPSPQLKHDHEYNNLVSILQFYQLWCHGMFPKANFKDCAYLVRSLGHKSSQLRLYRRELIEKEIYKLKVERGIIDENEVSRASEEAHTEDNTNSQMEGDNITELRPTAITANDDDDDTGWDFMRIGATSDSTRQDSNGEPNRTETIGTTNDPAEDGWDDLEDDEVAAFFGKPSKTAPQIANNDEESYQREEAEEEDEDLALELMRQVDP